MPILIDTCCLANVFNAKAKRHKEFYPVLKWIVFGKGKALLGGSRYARELSGSKSYLNAMVNLERAGKTIRVDRDLVDKKEKEVEKRINNKDFDDPHIMSMLIVSRVMLLCTLDSRSFKFIGRTEFYVDKSAPFYFTGRKNNHKLLCDKYVRDGHGSSCRLAKAAANKLLDQIVVN